ncbi:MAG: TlpA family protein disulfide reductase [Egibacteraceae bacterium]
MDDDRHGGRCAGGAERTPLPEVTLPAFGEGTPVGLASYRGQPLVVNFWATWCAPCVEEMPALQQVAAALRGRVAVLGVNVKDNPESAARFVRTLEVAYDQASDPRGEFLLSLGGLGLPTTLLVDPSGVIVYRRTGALTVEEFRELIREHLDVGA